MKVAVESLDHPIRSKLIMFRLMITNYNYDNEPFSFNKIPWLEFSYFINTSASSNLVKRQLLLVVHSSKKCELISFFKL